MSAYIQFARGITEETIPDVRLTRGRNGESGRAIFFFEAPQVFAPGSQIEVTGMYLIDEEGELVTREVKGKFVNGEATSIEAIYYMRSQSEWDRFMRFMNRYAEANGLGLSKA